MEAEKGRVLLGQPTFQAQLHPFRISAPARTPKPRPAEALPQLSLGLGNLVYFLKASLFYLLPKPCPRKGTKKVALYFTSA
jgi:hypothetical protein